MSALNRSGTGPASNVINDTSKVRKSVSLTWGLELPGRCGVPVFGVLLDGERLSQDFLVEVMTDDPRNIKPRRLKIMTTPP
jgi:hypothetical protein